MPLVRKLISWLTFHPTTDEVARALATDYFAEFSAQGVRFSRLRSDDSIIILGEYGFEDSAMWKDRVIPSSEWRARDTEPASVLKGERQDRWCNNSTAYIETLLDRWPNFQVDHENSQRVKMSNVSGFCNLPMAV